MKKSLWLLLVFLMGLWLTIPFIHQGLPISDDGKDHVARIANFYLSLSEGHIIPRWAENLNWGFGHPILEFLYPLPSYIASLFHFMGFSFIDSTKIVLGLGLFLSGLTMYLWLGEFLKKPAATLGGILYMYAPYRLIDAYKRGDIGENLAFIFMPLILFFMLRFSKKQTLHNMLGIALCISGLILSHNAISLMYLPFVIFYGFYLSYFSKQKKILLSKFSIGIILGFCLSAFFWLPALVEGKYTLRNIVTIGEYRNRFIPLQGMLYDAVYFKSKPVFALEIGLLNILLIILSFYFMMTKKTDKTLIAIVLLYTFGAMFLMIPQADFIWQHVMLLQNFQFPWRFLAVPSFTVGVLGAMFLDKLSVKFQYTFVIIISIFLIVVSTSFWPRQGYLIKPDSFFSGVYDGTTDTGESAPMWSVRFMEHRFTKPMEVIGGKAVVRQISRKSTQHVYSITASTTAQLLENTLFFPGWEIFVDGQKTNVEFQDIHHRGLMTFYVPQGVHTVVVRYSETRLRKIADLISGLSIIVAFGILLFRKFVLLPHK